MHEAARLDVEHGHMREIKMLGPKRRSGLVRGLSLRAGLPKEGRLKSKSAPRRIHGMEMARHIPPFDLELGVAAMISRKGEAASRLRYGKPFGGEQGLASIGRPGNAAEQR